MDEKVAPSAASPSSASSGTSGGVLAPLLMLVAAILLVGGQWLFERQLGQAATLSVVVEFAGGLLFLYLLLKGRIR